MLNACEGVGRMHLKLLQNMMHLVLIQQPLYAYVTLQKLVDD